MALGWQRTITRVERKPKWRHFKQQYPAGAHLQSGTNCISH